MTGLHGWEGNSSVGHSRVVLPCAVHVQSLFRSKLVCEETVKAAWCNCS